MAFTPALKVKWAILVQAANHPDLEEVASHRHEQHR